MPVTATNLLLTLQVSSPWGRLKKSQREQVPALAPPLEATHLSETIRKNDPWAVLVVGDKKGYITRAIAEHVGLCLAVADWSLEAPEGELAEFDRFLAVNHTASGRVAPLLTDVENLGNLDLPAPGVIYVADPALLPHLSTLWGMAAKGTILCGCGWQEASAEVEAFASGVNKKVQTQDEYWQLRAKASGYPYERAAKNPLPTLAIKQAKSGKRGKKGKKQAAKPQPGVVRPEVKAVPPGKPTLNYSPMPKADVLKSEGVMPLRGVPAGGDRIGSSVVNGLKPERIPNRLRSQDNLEKAKLVPLHSRVQPPKPKNERFKSY